MVPKRKEITTMNTPAATVCNPYRRMFSLAILPRYKPKQNSVARVTLKEVMYASKRAKTPFIDNMKGISETIAVNAGEAPSTIAA